MSQQFLLGPCPLPLRSAIVRVRCCSAAFLGRNGTAVAWPRWLAL